MKEKKKNIGSDTAFSRRKREVASSFLLAMTAMDVGRRLRRGRSIGSRRVSGEWSEVSEKGRLLRIMSVYAHNIDIAIGQNLIHKAVFVGYAPAPASFQLIFERFRFAREFV